MSGRIIGYSDGKHPIVETYHCFLDAGGSCPHTAPQGVPREEAATEYAARRANRAPALGDAAAAGVETLDPLLAGDVLGPTTSRPVGALALGRQVEAVEPPVVVPEELPVLAAV